MVKEIFQYVLFFFKKILFEFVSLCFFLALQTVGLFRIGVSKKRLKEVKLHRRSSETEKKGNETIRSEFS